MRKLNGILVDVFFAAFLLLAVNCAQAGTLTVPYTFIAGTPAVAANVNSNFTAVKTAVDDNDSRIATLLANVTALQSAVATLQTTVSSQATTIASLQTTVSSQATTIASLQTTVSSQTTAIATLQADLATVKTSNAMAMSPYISVTSDARGPLIQLVGVNVQVINGLGSTNTTNGLGNLIVGYDEADTSGILQCDVGTNPSTGALVTDSTTCAAAGGTWSSAGFKSGSHNLVLGFQNNYSSYSGILAGMRNTSKAPYASIIGGMNNTASNQYAVVTSGNFNIASGVWSSITGGNANTASGQTASVSGGSFNTASGQSASVGGGATNTASGSNSSVSGGNSNTASGGIASILGGKYNIASGAWSSVAGGGDGTVAGGNTAATNYSTILGGVSKTTTLVSESQP